jgi:hypothetical protein
VNRSKELREINQVYRNTIVVGGGGGGIKGKGEDTCCWKENRDLKDSFEVKEVKEMKETLVKEAATRKLVASGSMHTLKEVKEGRDSKDLNRLKYKQSLLKAKKQLELIGI